MIQNSRRAILFALAGFMLLSVGDAVVKTMSGQWPGSAVAALRYAFGAAGLAAIVAWRMGRAGFRIPRAGLQFARGAAVAAATLGFFLGVQVMPLADATAIVFTSPLLTVLISALFLHERIPRATGVALALAFAGVLIVLRPNVAALGLAALLPLGAALAMAVLMILNRRAAGLASALSLQMALAFGATPLLIAAAVAGHLTGDPRLAVGMPDLSVVARCALVAVTATTGHWLIFRGTELASAATIAPTTYSELIVAVTAGMLMFGDVPDFVSVGGMALIVAGGLWLWRAQKAPAVAGTPD